MKKYLNKKEAIMYVGWISYDSAFPDALCECLKTDFIPVKCKKCGADRTSNNWRSLLNTDS